MSRQQYENLLNNPKVRTMLNLIAQTEGVKWGYNTLFGNQKVDSLAAHPNIRKEFTQTDGRKNYTTAAGRYQFLKGTWDGLQKQLGLSDFSPRSQDLGAIALLAENGALPYVLKGDYQTAVKKSGTTWASLPTSTYAQGKRSWDFVNKHLGGDIGSARPLGKINSSELSGILLGGGKAVTSGSISAQDFSKIMTPQDKQQVLGSISASDFQNIMNFKG